MAIENCFKQTHCVSYSTNIDIVMLYYITSEYIRHKCLANFLCTSCLLLAIENWFNQTHGVRYLMKITTGKLFYLVSDKNQTLCVRKYNVLKFFLLLDIESGLRRHNLLSIPQILIQLCCIIYPVKKSDTIC